METFTENVTILTGASMGIGEQLAYQLAEQGAYLALAARSADKLEAVATECKKRGGEAIAIQTDLTDEVQCKRLVSQTVDAYGRIDTLLYNAGYAYPKRFDTMPDLSNLKSELALNYLGLVYCTYYALPYIQKARGRIVGVCSLNGLIGMPGTTGYNSSKHAMSGFLNTLRAELVGTGVSVTVIFVSAIRTKRLEETMGANIHRIPTLPPDRCAQIILQTAVRRQRQLVMTPTGKLLVFLYQFIPGLLDPLLARIANAYTDK